MTYVLLSATWAVVLYLLLRPKYRDELSSYSKALESLANLAPQLTKEIGNAVQANLYPSITLQRLADENGSSPVATGHQGNQSDQTTDGVFEAVTPFPLDWEDVDGVVP